MVPEQERPKRTDQQEASIRAVREFFERSPDNEAKEQLLKVHVGYQELVVDTANEFYEGLVKIARGAVPAKPGGFVRCVLTELCRRAMGEPMLMAILHSDLEPSENIRRGMTIVLKGRPVQVQQAVWMLVDQICEELGIESLVPPDPALTNTVQAKFGEDKEESQEWKPPVFPSSSPTETNPGS